MSKLFLILSILLISFYVSGQSDTVWNKTDEKGLKQGFWRVSHENGNIKYQGFFKNNKPIGLFKRYYEEGVIKAIQIYQPDGLTVNTELYYNNGTLAAKGKYVNSIKDSIWMYYSFYDKTLKLIENYKLGKKEGVSKKFYESGQIAEELYWNNNMKNGSWIQYFKNGDTLLKTNYINDKRQGTFVTYYPNKKIESKGQFIDNLMEGDWLYYDENGNQKMKIIYKKGIPQNRDQLDKMEEEFFKKIEENKGKIPEPDETNFMP